MILQDIPDKRSPFRRIPSEYRILKLLASVNVGERIPPKRVYSANIMDCGESSSNSTQTMRAVRLCLSGIYTNPDFD